jgi:hypothetical protein
MAFILWRSEIGGHDQYVSGWAAKGGLASYSNNLKDAKRYQTRAAADDAANRSASEKWQVREIADPG